MREELPRIDALRGLGLLQQEFIRIALHLSKFGSIEFEGKLFSCTLHENQREVSSVLAMAAGQSLGTVIKMAQLRGIPIRDMYPVARSAVETFINASFLLSERDEVVRRAMKHVQFAYWKQHNRKFGNGDFTIEVRLDSRPEETMTNEFPEFIGKGKSGWTSLDVPSRIRRVKELAGIQAGSRLLAAYGLIYSLSSEIIHGSLFGVSYFYTSNGVETADEVMMGIVRQAENILISVIHAACGYLAAFFNFQQMEALSAAEQKIFDRLLALSTMDATAFPEVKED